MDNECRWCVNDSENYDGPWPHKSCCQECLDDSKIHGKHTSEYERSPKGESPCSSSGEQAAPPVIACWKRKYEHPQDAPFEVGRMVQEAREWLAAAMYECYLGEQGLHKGAAKAIALDIIPKHRHEDAKHPMTVEERDRASL